MIEIITDEITSVHADAVLLEVNCVGNLERSFPRLLKNEFSEFVTIYKAAFDEGKIEPGKLLIGDRGNTKKPQYAFHFPTRVHWKGERRPEILTEGIAELTRQVVSLGIKKIAIPRWGDGPGMSWSNFKKLLLCSMARIPDVRFVVCPSIESITTLKQISIFTDGAAEPNPGPGGYGVILRYANQKRELSGSFQTTTNNRMELMAAIVGMETLKEACVVKLYSDSRYIVDAINTGWLFRWCANNWLGKKAKNVDLWKRFVEVYLKHDVELIWVKGHAGIDDNERCDQLASIAIQKGDFAVDIGYIEDQKSLSLPTQVDLLSGLETTASNRPIQSSAGIASDSNNAIRNGRGPKPKKEGDLCRNCFLPLVRRETKKSNLESNYHYPWHLYCKTCKRIYHVDAAKVFRQKRED